MDDEVNKEGPIDVEEGEGEGEGEEEEEGGGGGGGREGGGDGDENNGGFGDVIVPSNSFLLAVRDCTVGGNLSDRD